MRQVSCIPVWSPNLYIAKDDLELLLRVRLAGVNSPAQLTWYWRSNPVHVRRRLLAAVRSSLELAFEPSAEVGHGFVGSGLVTGSGFRVICVLLTLSPAGRMAPMGGMAIKVVSSDLPAWFSRDMLQGVSSCESFGDADI